MRYTKKNHFFKYMPEQIILLLCVFFVYIELNAFLKVSGVASSGGEAKQIIRSGEVLVNGESETRNRKKLVAGDKVTFEGQEFLVTSDVTRMGEE